jgi:uncharacterized membrane protein YfcA
MSRLLQLGLVVVLLYVAAIMVLGPRQRAIRSDEAKNRSVLSRKLRKAWRTTERILAIFAIIGFAVGFAPLALLAIKYWLGLPVPPLSAFAN